MSTTITDYAGLVAIGDDLAGDYVLGNNIDASGETFTPLGTFTGTLKGRGYKVSDLAITVNGAATQEGAFILENQGTIQDIELEDCVISVTSTNGLCSASGIALDNNGGTISNIKVSGTITATTGTVVSWAVAAGITKNNYSSGIIEDCGVSAAITATSARHAMASGVVSISAATVRRSYSTGAIVAESSYGGATADVHAAGVVAWNGSGTDGSIDDCYSRGAISATSVTAGAAAYAAGVLVLNDTAGSTVSNAYSTGLLTGDDGVAGICQTNSGTITACFWDTETSGTAVSDGGTGKTTAEMKTRTTFTDADWDFIVIWCIDSNTNDGYPFFYTLTEPADGPRSTEPIQDKVTLEAMRNLEMSALGRFRVDKEGNATYKSRYARNA